MVLTSLLSLRYERSLYDCITYSKFMNNMLRIILKCCCKCSENNFFCFLSLFLSVMSFIITSAVYTECTRCQINIRMFCTCHCLYMNSFIWSSWMESSIFFTSTVAYFAAIMCYNVSRFLAWKCSYFNLEIYKSL